MIIFGVMLIVHLLFADFFTQSVLAVQCYACQHLPCTELTCEGSWCMKSIVYDRNKDHPKIIADCVPEDLHDRVKKEECESVRNDDLGLWGTRCFCKTKLCNGAVRRHVNPVSLPTKTEHSSGVAASKHSGPTSGKGSQQNSQSGKILANHQRNGDQALATRPKNRKKKIGGFLSLNGPATSNQLTTPPVTSTFRPAEPQAALYQRPNPIFRVTATDSAGVRDYVNSSNSILTVKYLPARPRKLRESSKDPLRKARLAEPEQSISDISTDSTTAPPSPPIPSEFVHLSPPVFKRDDSYASARDVLFEPKSKAARATFTVQEPEPALTVEEASQTLKTPEFISGQRSNSLFGQDFFRRRLTLRSSVSGPDGIREALSLAYPTSMDAMKWAFYNVSVFTMAVCSVLGAVAAYFLFYEFVKPAMWAIICGIVLYPLKRKLTGVVKHWLDHLNESGKPLTFAIAALPLDVTNQLGEFLLDSMTHNFKMVLLMVTAFPTSALILQYETIPRTLVTAKRFLVFVDNMVGLFNGVWVPALLMSYLTYICLSSMVNRFRNDFLCHVFVSWMVWTAGIAYGCNYFGPFRTPIFVGLLIMCCTYYVPLFNAVLTTKKAFTRLSRRSTKRRTRRRSGAREAGARDSRMLNERSPSKSPAKDAGADSLRTDTSAIDNDSAESNIYLKKLFIACFFVYISLHLWIMFLLVLPIGVALLRRIVVKFDICAIVERNWQTLKSRLDGDIALLFPAPFLHVFRVLLHIDRQVIYYLRQSMDLVGSLTAMILLLVIVASVAGFIIFQLYYESMHLINLTADIANQTLTKNPGLQKWLRQTVHVDSVADLANEAVQRAYSMSKNWLSAQMQEIIQNNPEKAKLLESQVVNALDTFFHNWLLSRNATNITALAGPAGHKTAIAQWADVWTALGESGGDIDWNIFDNLHEYISLMLSVADSAWMILKNNMEILVVGFSQVASTLLASGTAVVDFFLDSIVFLSFLMYLLSESDQEYKPLKMIRDLVPSGQETASKITEQVEQAVNGVFLATSKMAIFYGMFTWLTHTLFAVNLVFIPSVLAGVFAAIPFFGTYLVALPAILELWLIRGEPFLAVFLFILHYVPSYVVDDAIYSDIRLTTPLLSGMAIAGGVLWWGLEGAIFGPLVLCCILVLGGVYKAIFFKTMTAAPESPSSKDDSDNEEQAGIRGESLAPAVRSNGDMRHDRL